ncbi:WD40/YVTN/BNR-like repeat-containing protein [Parasediminibacterium paludis]|uniref:WD40/YVTN/BNR-like repeat-containing protein n=1 Tax=Parasediminibacterium paludis TaxID=908966 RepID=A0ABV8PYT8_9BACT
MMKSLSCCLCITLSVAAFSQKKTPLPKDSHAVKITDANDYYKPLLWRNIGPMRGGRSVTSTGVVGNPLVYYMGTTGGGVWKTEDAGLTWNNISDGYFKTGSVGAVAVAESDPNTVYVGMGEHAMRGVMSSYGDGVYKSTDAGKTWKHLGLDATRQIANVRIHPQNANIAYVAAQGAVHGATPDRGVYRTTDGGKTWDKVLFVDDNTGCVDLSMDMNNPNILYAAMWDHRRLPWEVRSGGKGSGLYKSTDGGDTWEKIQNGLPKELGKMSISLTKANSEKLYLVVESDSQKELGGLFVSNDAGGHWERVSKDHRLVQRAWYYIESVADPLNENIVYVLNSPAVKSIDGGKTWQSFRAPHGDYHQLWINPTNSKNMIVSNDGGAAITFNGGVTWSSQDNQPTAQFYRVNADNLYPYHLYGGQQDNTSVKIASQGDGYGGITIRDWSFSAGGESAFLAFDPNNPRYVMGGSYQGTIGLLDTKTNHQVEVMEYPAEYQALEPKNMKYRFNWNAPIIYSVHEPGTFYHAGNVLFKTTDFGKSWKVISPDLTTHDTSKMGVSGTPYTNEGAGGENYCTITYVMESPLEKGVIYTGSDDGLVYLTKDGGVNWTNITPPNMKGCLVNAIEVSPFDKATAYIAVNKYKLNDFTPIIYKTTDYGNTWEKLTEGIPYGACVRVVREDNQVKDILYAGTETGLYLSYNGGKQWQPLQLNLPVTPITDLKLHQDHLLASTQGRAFWVLDDLTPLRQNSVATNTAVDLLPVKDAVRASSYSPLNQSFPDDMPVTKIKTTMVNPASGAVIYFHLQNKDSIKNVTIDILDASKNTIRTFYKEKPKLNTSNNQLDADEKITLRNGLNKFVWDLQYANLPTIDNVYVEGDFKGRMAIPGNYTVKLTIDGKSYERDFKLLPDPTVTASAAEYAAQDQLLKAIADDITDLNVSVVHMRKIKNQLEQFSARVEGNTSYDSLSSQSKTLVTAIKTWEEQLIQPKSQSNDDVINFENKLCSGFIFLKGNVDNAIPYITATEQSRYAELHTQWMGLAEQKKRCLAAISLFNEQCNKAGIRLIGLEGE